MDELREHIHNRAQRAVDLSEVLPDAILLRAGRDPRLMRALQPLLEETLANSVRKDPRILAEAMFPVIAGCGPASCRLCFAGHDRIFESDHRNQRFVP